MIELLEIALSQLGKGYVSQLRDDVLIDAVFVVRLGLGLDGRFAVGPVPVIQPGPEGHVPLGPLRLRTLEALLQGLQLGRALPLGPGQYILRLWMALFIIAHHIPPLPAAVLS